VAAVVLVPVCGLVTVACAVSPTLTLLACVGLAIAVCIIRFPTFGVMLLVSFILAQDSPLFQQYGVLVSRGATVTDVGALLVLLGVALEPVWKPTDVLALLRGRAPLPVLAVAAYFGWGVVACFWSSAPTSALQSFLRLQVEPLLLLLLALLVLRKRSRVRWAMAAYSVTGVLLAVYVIHTFLSLHGLATGPLTTSQLQAYRGGPTGFNANELSIILSVVPAMTYLAAERLGAAVRCALTALTMPFVGFGLIILTSRSAILGLAASFVLALLLARGAKGRFAIGGLAAVAAALFALVSASGGLPYYFQQRFQLASTDQVGDRAPVWQLALDLFQRHPMGLGAAAFESVIMPTANVVVYVGVTSPHSDYIGTLVDLGLIGFVLLVVMLVLLGREIVFVGGRRSPAMIIIFSVLIISMFAGSFLQTHWYWAIMSLMLCYTLTTPLGAPGETAPRVDAK
jgi:O-antigen ligase